MTEAPCYIFQIVWGDSFQQFYTLHPSGSAAQVKPTNQAISQSIHCNKLFPMSNAKQTPNYQIQISGDFSV